MRDPCDGAARYLSCGGGHAKRHVLNCIELSTYTNTQMNACETGKISIRLVGCCINVHFLPVLLYSNYANDVTTGEN